jgi:hypothetical protein
MMNNTLKIFLIIILLFSGLAFSKEIENNKGTSGFQFLKIGIGSRDVAMAGASSSVTEGPAAMYWNPAGICMESSMDISFFYNNWIATIDHSFIGLTTPVSSNDYLGFSINYLTMDEMEETTIDQPMGTGRKFSVYDYAITMSYGRKITSRFDAALSVKYIAERIWDLEASGLAIDIGFGYRFDQFILGMSFMNFGTDKEISGAQLEIEQQIFPTYQTDEVVLSLKPKKIRLPSVFRFGVGYDLSNFENHKILFLGTVEYHNDIGERANLGMEYAFMNNYMLRGGYQFYREGFDWSFGAGIRVYVGELELIFDYSALNMDDFGLQHQTGITFKL